MFSSSYLSISQTNLSTSFYFTVFLFPQFLHARRVTSRGLILMVSAMLKSHNNDCLSQHHYVCAPIHQLTLLSNHIYFHCLSLIFYQSHFSPAFNPPLLLSSVSCSRCYSELMVQSMTVGWPHILSSNPGLHTTLCRLTRDPLCMSTYTSLWVYSNTQ